MNSITMALIALGTVVVVAIIFLLLKDKLPQKKEKTDEDIPQSNNNDLINYDVYIMTLKERILYSLIAAVAIFAVAFVFYQNVIISSIAACFSLLYPKLKAKDLMRKRKNELTTQFKDSLYGLSTSLAAGKSIEMAFRESLKDLKTLYPSSDAHIIKEFQYIVRKIDNGETVEVALYDLAHRANIEDIQSFADVFYSCKRSGGNLVKIIKNTSDIIRDKIEIKQDIETMITEKKFDQKILNIMPIGLILMLSLTAKDFMYPVFHSLNGRVVMTIALLLFVAAYFISKKIMDIEV
jgi:tight adherence protein B